MKKDIYLQETGYISVTMTIQLLQKKYERFLYTYRERYLEIIK